MGKIIVNSVSIRLSPKQVVGNGGEAVIYTLGEGKALKIFKDENHQDFSGSPLDQQAAKNRLRLHQKKLLDFPVIPGTNRIVCPVDLAYNEVGNVVGYTMKFLSGMEMLNSLAQRGFRSQANYSNEKVISLFIDKLATLKRIHSVGVVVGDSNDLNSMFAPSSPELYFIDVDSWQFKNYPCGVFTPRFVDPRLCDETKTEPVMVRPHDENSDWFAYNVMLFNSLLYTSPYGGIHKPKNRADSVKQGERALKRLSVFNKEVVYPKPAQRYDVLPDELLQHFLSVFEKDARGEMPEQLLSKMSWKTCPACGLEHARNHCPQCTLATPTVVQKAVEVRGTVTSRLLFRTRGTILYATLQSGKLSYLYHEDGQYFREEERKVMTGPLEKMRIRITGQATHFAREGTLSSLDYNSKHPSKLRVDSYGTLPLFDANNKGRFWVESGKLLTDGDYGQVEIGSVLDYQTLFWVSNKLGFGFYRAAELCIAFIFNPNSAGINDCVKLPQFKGQLIDSTCTFSDNKVWFFATLNQKGRLINQCYVINKVGQVEAFHEQENDSLGWLSGIRGKCATDNYMLVPTDSGVVRVEQQGSTLVETKKFVDTADFVSSTDFLFAGKIGLLVVSKNEVRQLEIR